MIQIGIDETVEAQPDWSRRVHALERIADKVPVWNRYPVFFKFDTDMEKRFLYSIYPSVRGHTLFNYKDKIYLTQCRMLTYFNFDKLQSYGLTVYTTALHDANRGDKLTIFELRKRWAFGIFFSSAKEAGSPLVTDEAYEHDTEVSWYLRPFSQPLQDIRDYFAERIALFYAWLGHYTLFLLIPTVFSAGLLLLWHYLPSDYFANETDWYQVGLMVIIAIWSHVYVKYWRQQSLIISIKWGTKGLEELEKDRTSFIEVKYCLHKIQYFYNTITIFV